MSEDLEETVAELEADLEEADEELTAQKLRQSEWDESTPYEQLALDDKVGMVREHAFRKATDAGGRTRLTYDDVMWEVFDGHPSAKHCYKLMRMAAGTENLERAELSSPVLGFAYRDPEDGVRHLAVDAERAKRGAAFLPGNNAGAEGVR